MAGTKWLDTRTYRIIVVESTTDCGLLVSWHYADQPETPYTSDGYDFHIWGRFKKVG